MGLDNAWVLPGKDNGCSKKHPNFDPPLNLVGGMFSGYGRCSFRGKVYSDRIEKITGESLYQQGIPNTTIRKMAAKLREFRATEEFFHDYHCWQGDTFDRFLSEINDIRRMFIAYADAGASLAGWW
jgi:hypothetical protein